ncbi:MAG: RNase H-like domain-containing protein [Anaerolineales bacterium]
MSLDAIGRTEQHVKSFRILTEAIRHSATLAHPNEEHDFFLFSDASDLSWGAI